MFTSYLHAIARIGLAVCGAALISGCGDRTEPVVYPRLALQEELRIRNPSEGGVGSDIVGAAVDHEGRLYLMDAAIRQLLVFDSTGRFLHAIGKAGEAPGEFMMLGSLGLIGDTVWLADPRLGRITLFSRKGTLIRTMDNTEDLSVAGLGRYSLLGLLHDGSRLVGVTPDPAQVDMKVDRSVPFLRISKGGRADTLFQLPISGAFRVGVGRSSRLIQQPFDGRPTIGVRRDGAAWIEVAREAGESGPAAATITRFSLERGREWSRAVPLNTTRVPRNMRDSILDGVTATPAEEKALAEWLRIPRRLPLVTSATLSEDGTIWLNEASVSDTTRWVRLDSLGNPRGALLLPRDHQLLHASHSRLWMLERDRAGRLNVVRYSVK